MGRGPLPLSPTQTQPLNALRQRQRSAYTRPDTYSDSGVRLRCTDSAMDVRGDLPTGTHQDKTDVALPQLSKILQLQIFHMPPVRILPLIKY